MKVARYGLLNLISAAVVVVAVGCSAHQSADPSPQASSSNSRSAAPAVTPTAASQFDAQWMGIDASQPWNWEEVDREITKIFQQFGFRPVGETEVPRRCNGCGEHPSTAFLTVYAPGTFDPTNLRTGQPVSVNGAEGFFHPSQGLEDAVLTWPYAENAWAAVRGRTTTTSELGRMVELASALRPAERTPIRLPLSLPNVPANMPLASISNYHGHYGTALTFDACAKPGYQSPAPDCVDESDHLRVQIWRTNGYDGHIDEQDAVPWTIGGRDGVYDKSMNEAAVQVQPGMLVMFALSDAAGGNNPTTNMEEILATVEWAPDPGNEATWRAVTEWAK